MASPIAFFSSSRFVEHDTGPSHPERPDRIRAIHRAVRLAGLIDSPDPFPEFKIQFGPGLAKSSSKILDLEAQPAAESWLETVHTRLMIDKVKRACEHAAVLDQSDTPTCKVSFEIAMLSLGSALGACDFVMQEKGRRAFSAARPPGHHAEMARSMGFCLFNNAAIAARYLQRQYAIERVAIVDFDVHHGNGTQDVFESDPSVLYVSIHEDPRVLYPGSGHEHEIGVGAAKGTKLNIALRPGSGDREFVQAWERVEAHFEQWRPEVFVFQCGADGLKGDPLAHLEYSPEVHAHAARRLCALAEKHAKGRIMAFGGGGYNRANLGLAWSAVLREFIG